MSQLHLPWLELAVLIPLVGALFVARLRDSYEARKWCAVISLAALACTTAAWLDFAAIGASEASDKWDVVSYLIGQKLLVMDELSAPLLPMAGLLHFLTTLATLRTKMRRFSFAWSLVAESIRLAAFSCKEPWGVIALLSLGTIPPFLELRARGKSTRVYVLHMLAFVAMMVVGWGFASSEGTGRVHSLWAIVPLLLAVVIRSGMIPGHLWITDLFEKATFGTALLFVMPLTGAYAALRLVLPIAPEWVLHSIGLLSLATVVYSAGMALVQREARRFFCFVFLSHSALVLVGMLVVNPIGLTGALSLWLSIAFSLGGFGLTLRALESRFGRLSLVEFHGLYEHTPALAICFALTGLASVGFPGTLGFVGTEMLVEGAVEAYPYVGIVVVIATAMNGIAVVRAYFWLFTGTRHSTTVSLQIGLRERIAVLTLAALILGGGFFPQPGVKSRYHAAQVVLDDREAHHLNNEEEEDDHPVARGEAGAADSSESE